MSHTCTSLHKCRACVRVCVFAPASLGGNICCRVSVATCWTLSCNWLTSLQDWFTICMNSVWSRKICVKRNSRLITLCHRLLSETMQIHTVCPNETHWVNYVSSRKSSRHAGSNRLTRFLHMPKDLKLLNEAFQTGNHLTCQNWPYISQKRTIHEVRRKSIMNNFSKPI